MAARERRVGSVVPGVVPGLPGSLGEWCDFPGTDSAVLGSRAGGTLRTEPGKSLAKQNGTGRRNEIVRRRSRFRTSVAIPLAMALLRVHPGVLGRREGA